MSTFKLPWFVVYLVSVLFFNISTQVSAQTILNPFYDDPDWKLWYEDDTTVYINPPLVNNPVDHLSALPPGNRLYPDDADTSLNPGLFLSYQSSNFPSRRYDGFWNDVYASLDKNSTVPTPHSYIRGNWIGNDGNSVKLLSPDSIMNIHLGYMTVSISPTRVRELKDLGVNWTSQSSAGMGDAQTDSFNDIDQLEKDLYFANILRAGPAHTSYLERSIFNSVDNYDAVVPVFYNSISSSGGETMALTKLAAASGYLDRAIKPELKRNGLYMPTMLYLWKESLPYDTPYEDELRHRVAYMSYGDGSKDDYGGLNRPQIAASSYYYDPTKHMSNMVATAKEMKIAPPIALFSGVQTISGTEMSVNKTTVRVHQAADEIAQIRISVAESFDLQGLNLDYHWNVLHGSKDTTIEHEGNSTYLITVPYDSALPQGRTAISLVANNGFYDSNPAILNVFRTSGSTKNYRTRTVTGLSNRAIPPGEIVNFDLDSRDPEGFPVTYSKWEGVGDLDGNRFQWVSSVVTAEGEYPVNIVASDGTNGNGYNSSEATITVSNTVAELLSNVNEGIVPLTVNFNGIASRDRDGNNLSLVWNFDDGSTDTVVSPVHTFTQPGIYNVALTATGPLGSHTANKIIEVKHNWSLALNNGWDTSGIDTAVWNSTGATVATSLTLGTRLRISGGAENAPVSITSVQSFNTPVYIESEFRRSILNSKTAETGFQLLGSNFGNLAGYGSSHFMEKDMSIGHLNDADPNVWDYQYIGTNVRYPDAVSQLRIYIDDDPNNPGKIRYRGFVDSDLGRYTIQFDNQDPTESWFNNILGISSEDPGNFELWRYQVWTPSGGAQSAPEIYLTNDSDQSAYNRVLGVANIVRDTVIENSTADFGEPSVIGGSVTKIYTIHNKGDTVLNLTAASPYISLTGTNAADFVVSTSPVSPVPAGGSTPFSVTFTPGGVGMRTATLEIPSDDADEGVLKLNVHGRDRTAKEINVQGNGLNIVSGSTNISLSDHTDFGPVAGTSSQLRSFIVHNLGTEGLLISGINVTGTNASDFTVVKSTRSLINSLESAVFEIEFTPGATGLRTAGVEIISNDSDEAIYTFNIQGQGVEGFVFDQAEPVVNEGSNAVIGVKLSAAPGTIVSVTSAINSSAHLDDDIFIISGASLSFDGSNWNTYQYITVAAAEDDIDTFDGYALLNVTASDVNYKTANLIVQEQDNDTSSIPVATGKSLSTDDYCPVSTRLLAHDFDEDTLTTSISTGPTNGAISGTFPDITYTPDPGFVGTDSFTFIANDGVNNSNAAVVTVTVVTADSDNDGLSDGQENCVYGTNPALIDSDRDGLTDGDEVYVFGTDPADTVVNDQDVDGLSDNWETAYGTNISSNDARGDADGDGIENIIEYLRYTSPIDVASAPILDTIHVDASVGAGGDGSINNPFSQLTTALNAAQHGDTLQLASGLHTVPFFFISKSVKFTGPADQSARIDFTTLYLYNALWGGFYNLTLSPNATYLTSLHNFEFDSNHLLPGTNFNITQNSQVSFVNNLIENPGLATQAFSIINNSQVTLTNNTIVGFPVGIYLDATVPTTSATVRNSILSNTDDFDAPSGGIDVAYSFIGDGEFAGSNGNVTGSIQFVDAASGDYRLQAASPAMDSGDPSSVYFNEPEPNGCRINMGAYGNSGSATVSDAVYDTDGLQGHCETYTILNPALATGDLSLVSLEENNTIVAGNTTLNLGRYGSGTILAGELAQGARIIASGAIDTGSSIDATDMAVPGRFSGTEFVIPHYRYNHHYYMQSPEGDARVLINIAGIDYPLTLREGEVIDFDAGSNNTVLGVITSDRSILVMHRSYSGSTYVDAYAVPPAANEIWGIRSNGAFIGALKDNTHVTIYSESGVPEVVTMQAGDRRSINIASSGSQGTGDAIHVVADQPIAGAQGADGDGVEQTAFMRTSDLGVRFGVPTDAQYVSVICAHNNTVVTLYDNTGLQLDQQTCTGDNVTPGKVYFGSTANGVQFTAGAYLESDQSVMAIYEDAATSDERNLSGYTRSGVQYHVLNPDFTSADMNIVSLVDNNSITAGNTTLKLGRYEFGTIPAAELVQGGALTGSGAFDAGSSIDATDMPMPDNFAGTEFVIPHYRYTHHYYLLSPEGGATVSIQVGANSYTDIILNQDEVLDFDAGSNNTVSGLITSDTPILVMHRSFSGSNYADAYPVPPAKKEVWGIRSTGAYIGALLNNTAVTIYASDGATPTNIVMNAGDRHLIADGTSDGQASGLTNGIRVVADKPVAGIQVADNDGVEQTAFVPTEYLGMDYGIPTDAQYIAVVCPASNTQVSLYDNAGGLLEQQSCTGNNVSPGKVYFGTTSNLTNFIAGSYLVSDKPIFTIYEDSLLNDEHNLFGYRYH